MTITGNVGVLFNLDEQATLATGTIEQTYAVPDAIGQLTITEETDQPYSVTGSVGTTAFDFDLTAINNQSGTGYSTSVIRNQGGSYTTVKTIVIYNTHASNNLILGASSANNFFTWNATSNTIAIVPGEAKAFIYSTAVTVGSNGKFNLKGGGASTTFQLYLLGA